MALTRRRFLATGLAVPAATACSAFIPTRANAWVVTAVIAAASLATNLIARGPRSRAAALAAQANLQILVSISKEVGAINRSLQLALTQLFDIRRIVERNPQLTVEYANHNAMAALWRRYRELLDAYVDQLSDGLDADGYYRSLHSLYNEYSLSRAGLMEVSNDTGYDYTLHVAVAQEHEIMMALELASPDSRAAGTQFDLSQIRSALTLSYIPYLEAALSPDNDVSLVSTISALEARYQELRTAVDGTTIGSFFRRSQSGPIACTTRTDTSFRNTRLCPTIVMGQDDGCDWQPFQEVTLTQFIANRESEALSDGRLLFTGNITKGDSYKYRRSVENIVMDTHNYDEVFCGGTIDNVKANNISGDQLDRWQSSTERLNHYALQIESLYAARNACRLALSSARCRLALLKTGEHTCGI